jgi:hypothetical protein
MASNQHWDEIDDDDAKAPGEDKVVRPRTNVPEDPIKHNLLEYFGADGKDEGQKFAQNADGSWGEEQNAAG